MGKGSREAIRQKVLRRGREEEGVELAGKALEKAEARERADIVQAVVHASDMALLGLATVLTEAIAAAEERGVEPSRDEADGCLPATSSDSPRSSQMSAQSWMCSSAREK